MKKYILIFIATFMLTGLAAAQTASSVYYIVGTSSDNVDPDNPGDYIRLIKCITPPAQALAADMIDSAIIDFWWKTGDNKTMLYFAYYDWNVAKGIETGKFKSEADKRAIEYKSMDYFNNVIYPQAYDLDKIISTNPSGESVEEWALPMYSKRVYFIDRNDMTSTQVKLIPVRVSIVNGQLLGIRK